MKVPFDPGNADDFIGDDEFGVFINIAEIHPNQWFYTLTKYILGTPVVEVADEGPFVDFTGAMSAASNLADKYCDTCPE